MPRARIAMFDDTNVGLIPRDAPAVAGYRNGRFLTWLVLKVRFPHAHKLDIAVSSSANARCLDVEAGDATNDVAAGWYHRQKARGVAKPVFYTSLSNAQALVDTLAKAGIKRGDYFLWVAHYTHEPHICSAKCGLGFHGKADATQWTDRSRGLSLDESLCEAALFGNADPLATGKVKFTKNEAHTLHLLMEERKRNLKGNSKAAKRRRANIRKYKRTLLVYRAKLRLAAADSGWDKADRRRRYAGLLTVYGGGTIKL